MSRISLRSSEPRLSVRIDLSGSARLGPGKIALLEAIGREGSISAAARALGMSYRRAWLLVDSVNRMFAQPAVVTHPGRAKGGGTELSVFGRRLIDIYRSVEKQARRATDRRIGELAAALRKPAARRRRLQTPGS